VTCAFHIAKLCTAPDRQPGGLIVYDPDASELSEGDEGDSPPALSFPGHSPRCRVGVHRSWIAKSIAGAPRRHPSPDRSP
jgi:hypothetical protein